METKSHTFKVKLDKIYKLRAIIDDLPPFCTEFFRGIENQTSLLTRLNYAYDLRIFFNYLVNNIEPYKGIKIKEFSLNNLNQIETVHIEMFLEYLSYYHSCDKEYINNAPGKARKLSTLRSFFYHFYKKEKLTRNIAILVDLPKRHEKPIIRLEPDEVAKLIDTIESGSGLTESQKKYHQLTKNRDLTIVILLLGTGIRISECVGLNIKDFDFSTNGFRVTRKGGNQTILYFGDEVREILSSYLRERKQIIPLPGHEDALFLSIQKKRITNRAVQNIVKKYSKLVTPLKNISPHKLRSTYGTTLYRETGDIYLVADVLGHKDVNTTKKHYAAIDDEKRRVAANKIKLR